MVTALTVTGVWQRGLQSKAFTCLRGKDVWTGALPPTSFIIISNLDRCSFSGSGWDFCGDELSSYDSLDQVSNIVYAKYNCTLFALEIVDCSVSPVQYAISYPFSLEEVQYLSF